MGTTLQSLPRIIRYPCAAGDVIPGAEVRPDLLNLASAHDEDDADGDGSGNDDSVETEPNPQSTDERVAPAEEDLAKTEVLFRAANVPDPSDPTADEAFDSRSKELGRDVDRARVIRDIMRVTPETLIGRGPFIKLD